MTPEIALQKRERMIRDGFAVQTPFQTIGTTTSLKPF